MAKMVYSSDIVTGQTHLATYLIDGDALEQSNKDLAACQNQIFQLTTLLDQMQGAAGMRGDNVTSGVGVTGVISGGAQNGAATKSIQFHDKRKSLLNNRPSSNPNFALQDMESPKR